MNQRSAIEVNRQAWQRLASENHRLTLTANEEDFAWPLRSVDGPGWLGPSIAGKTVLCLAAGGGRQGPLYAAAGARVTVVDFCDALLERDRLVAAERGLDLRTANACMTDLSELETASFDFVIHPVSSCYVPDLTPVFAAVARVCRPGGLYISQHKQPASLQASIRPGPDGYVLREAADRHDPLPAVHGDNLVREPGTVEFIHGLEPIVGGICRAGFVIEDLIEPPHGDPNAEPGSFAHRSRFLPPYVRIKARRTSLAPAVNQRVIWNPDF